MLAMEKFRRFLLVDDDPHQRFLISKTLLRHHPGALVQECQDLHTAAGLLHSLPPEDHQTVVLAHCTPQADGGKLVAALRAVHPAVPIVWVGEPQQAVGAKSAGATRFLDKNAWLTVGEVVGSL